MSKMELKFQFIEAMRTHSGLSDGRGEVNRCACGMHFGVQWPNNHTHDVHLAEVLVAEAVQSGWSRDEEVVEVFTQFCTANGLVFAEHVNLRVRISYSDNVGVDHTHEGVLLDVEVKSKFVNIWLSGQEKIIVPSNAVVEFLEES